MTAPLMPRATAVWLIDNTALTFQQIADFCQLHILEVKNIADNDAQQNIAGFDPVACGQLSWAEIKRCELDSNLHLNISEPTKIDSLLKKKRSKYTPLAKRQERPDAIAWLIKNHPNITDLQICKLLSTTKATVQAIRARSHWNSANIKPRHPVQLGFCSQEELDALIGSTN